MSDHEGHISIVKAADMINLGRNCIRRVPSNDDLTMNARALERMIDEDRAAGDTPFCVVAQVGSINVGVVDPLEEVGAGARVAGAQVHVGAAEEARGEQPEAAIPPVAGVE